ncbi:conserved hypothetical protein [Frankia sp. AgKG'84/4]
MISNNHRGIDNLHREENKVRFIERFDLPVPADYILHPPKIKKAGLLTKADNSHSQIEKRVVEGDCLPIQNGNMATVSCNDIVRKKITVAKSTGAMPLRLRGTHSPETLGEPAAEFFVDKLRNHAFLRVREPPGTAWDATQIWSVRV